MDRYEAKVGLDALVIFGATGDLAFKQIFPALQRLVSDGRLDVPIVGVAAPDWSDEQLVARAHESLSEYEGIDDAAFANFEVC